MNEIMQLIDEYAEMMVKASKEKDPYSRQSLLRESYSIKEKIQSMITDSQYEAVRKFIKEQ